MTEIKDKLDKISYEVWQIFSLMRILNYCIDYNSQFSDDEEDKFNISSLSQIITDRLKPISNELDKLSLKL